MLAAIDAGSNTLRLLIGDTDGKTVEPASYYRSITRLAGGLSESKGLSHEARKRTLAAFQEFTGICKRKGVTRCRSVGTAAFRKAVNGQNFAGHLKDVTGFQLEIISGAEEASLMTAGVLSALNPLPDSSLIIDIGGGSTEFVLCQKQKILWQASLPLGVVTLTESMTPKGRAAYISESIDQLSAKIARYLPMKNGTLQPLSLVGTAGTVTTLAALDMQMPEYDWKRINNYTISDQRVSHWKSFLAPLTVPEREELPGMEPGRGDLIMAGIDIISVAMRKFNSSSLTISDFGILERLLLSLSSGGKR